MWNTGWSPIYFTAPWRFKIFIVAGKHFWLYIKINKTYNTSFKSGGSVLWWFKELHVLCVNDPSNNFNGLSLLADFSYALEQSDILKITFKRKGGWMYIRRGWPTLLTFRFGYSHSVRASCDQLQLFRYKKYLAYHVLLVAGLLKGAHFRLGEAWRGVRPLNSYTKRGIRLSRQQLILRRGKESRYTKLKSKIF